MKKNLFLNEHDFAWSTDIGGKYYDIKINVTGIFYK